MEREEPHRATDEKMADLQVILDQHQRSLAFIIPRKDWIECQLELTENCDGLSKDGVRGWLKSVRAAIDRVQAGQDVHTDIHTLISRTAKGDLFDAYEEFMNAQPNRDRVRCQAALDDLHDVRKAGRAAQVDRPGRRGDG